MNPTDIDTTLAQTFADRRLSRAERRALTEVFAEADATSRGLYRHRAFELVRAHLATEGAVALDWLEEVVAALATAGQAGPPPSRLAEVHLSPGDGPLDRICGLIRGARETVDVCVFTITDDRIAEQLIAAHRRGVRLRVITDNEKAWDLGSDVEKLTRAGVSVRIDESPHHMHHKYAIFDGQIVLNGSYNWTRSAAENNEENILVTDDLRFVAAFREAFDALWTACG